MRRPVLVVLPLAVILALTVWRSRGPEPRPANASPSQFSAVRAMETLRGLLVDRVPHPVGTRANARVRSRIETQFRALGYDVSIQRRFACNATPVCAEVENILAQRPDAPPGEAVLLMAHYDSVGAGPGASDDGMGVAALLETARALRSERFRNQVRFLITDGEEAGLLGAEAFVADEQLSGTTGVVLNVEMRGTWGPSNMFETSRGNRWLIRHLASSLERPHSSSLFYTIYDLLPNDTDVSVFKRDGMATVNFAAIRGVQWYHTPLDDLAHADAGTLQHHGDNLLSLTRTLANADLAARSRSDATWFDLLGFTLIWWPQEWTLWIGVASLLLLLFAVRKLPPRTMTWGVLGTFAGVLLSIVLGRGVAWLANRGLDGINFAASQTPAVASMWLCGVAAAFAGMLLFKRSKDTEAMLYGVAIVWHVLGIVLALTLPGSAYLFIVPGVFMALCALADAPESVTASVGASVAAILIFPVGVVFYDALGARMLGFLAVVIGLLATLIAPMLATRTKVFVALLAALGCAAWAGSLPAYTTDAPRALSLAWIDDSATPSPYWATTAMTDPLQKAASFATADPRLAPWSRGEAWSAPAPELRAPRITMSGARNGKTVTLRVQSPRDADRITVFFSRGSVRKVNGVVPPPAPPRSRRRLPEGWSAAVLYGEPEMTLEIDAQGPLQVVASDTTFSFPAAGAALQRARNATPAHPAHDGDVTITRVRGKY